MITRPLGRGYHTVRLKNDMKYILSIILMAIVALKVYASDDYSFEISKYKPGKTCAELSGTWFTDITVRNKESGYKRDITRIDRKLDGTAYLRGMSIYLDTGKISFWDFPSKWSCDRKWYVEKNEWGYTAFKINKITSKRIEYIDTQNNLNAKTNNVIVEIKIPKNTMQLKSNKKAAEILEL